MRSQNITADEYRYRMLNAVSEKEWQRRVERVLKANGWMVYHTWDSRKSAAGFPDVVAAHPERGVVIAELKTMKGKLRKEQREWLKTLKPIATKTHNLHVFVWRPDDYSTIVELAGGVEPLR